MSNTAESKNTDRELWRGPDDGRGSFYADSIHVTEGGGIGIDVGGHVIVKPLRDWHTLAAKSSDGGVEGHAAVPLEIPTQRSSESRDPLGDGSVKVGPLREEAAGVEPRPSDLLCYGLMDAVRLSATIHFVSGGSIIHKFDRSDIKQLIHALRPEALGTADPVGRPPECGE